MRTTCLALAASALLLAACDQKGPLVIDAKNTPPAGVPVTATPAADCVVHITKDWINEQAPPRHYASEAATMGPTCEHAVVTLVVRGGDGTPVFAWSGITAQLFGLNEAKDAAAMKTALEDWIDQSNSNMKTSDQFPAWAETDGQPKAGEFPMHPETWYDQQAWEAMRKEKLDVFCFPQGMESLNCAVLRDGQMETVGLQQFPG